MGRGRILSEAKIVVRGYGLSIERTPSPQPSPHGRGSALPLFLSRANLLERSVVPTSSPAIDDIEEGLKLQPKFDASGLVTCVATEAGTGAVLMVAHMNDEALRKTIASGEAWYFSRSRNTLWRKGETSGHTQRVVEMRVDLRSGCGLDPGRADGCGVPHQP